MSKKALYTFAAVLLGTGVTMFAADDATQKLPKSVTVQMETTAAQDGGKALLTSEKNGVKIEIEFKNLSPGIHGIHIHQYPKCDIPDFKSAGGHFNPTGKQHGLDNPQGHHAGDLAGNITAGDDGDARATFFSKDLTLDPSKPNSVFANGGTALLVHAGPDDMKTDPSGNSGAREACGVISLANASTGKQSGAAQTMKNATKR